jgi:hypothetical protein
MLRQAGGKPVRENQAISQRDVEGRCVSGPRPLKALYAPRRWSVQYVGLIVSPVLGTSTSQSVPLRDPLLLGCSATGSLQAPYWIGCQSRSRFPGGSRCSLSAFGPIAGSEALKLKRLVPSKYRSTSKIKTWTASPPRFLDCSRQ